MFKKLKYAWVCCLLVVVISCGKTSNNQSLNLAPKSLKPGSSGQVLKLGIIGDINGSLGKATYPKSTHNSLAKLIASQPDLILGLGDITAGGDIAQNLPISTFPKLWSSFKLNILNPINKAGISFAPTPGNHDAGISRERVYYKDFFKSNKPNVTMVSDEMYPLYYSFLYQGVFFVSLDAVTVNTIKQGSYQGTTQRQWLKKQLSSNISKSSIARIVYGHVPLYPVLSKKKYSRGKYLEVLKNEQFGKKVDGLEELMKRNNVSLAIFGHSHAYYPGVVQHNHEAKGDALNILSMPCGGDGNRYLEGIESHRSKRGFAEVLIDLKTGVVSLDAYTDKGAKILKETLPREIKPSESVTIIRHDLF